MWLVLLALGEKMSSKYFVGEKCLSRFAELFIAIIHEKITAASENRSTRFELTLQNKWKRFIYITGNVPMCSEPKTFCGVCYSDNATGIGLGYLLWGNSQLFLLRKKVIFHFPTFNWICWVLEHNLKREKGADRFTVLGDIFFLFR